MWSTIRDTFGIERVGWAASGCGCRLFRPSGAWAHFSLPPTAYAVGCILSPLRGWHTGALLSRVPAGVGNVSGLEQTGRILSG